ncbi:MAG TPA: caspase family protein [Polyangia bacterium]|nr:caspase family protein [Polyangia bacterium]
MAAIAVAIASPTLAPRVARAETLHRFAVIVGNDSGGRDTRPLLYARADARKVHDILTRLGGVRADDAQLVLDGTAQDLLAALATAERRAADAEAHGERTALVVYYSGHAKDGALRLGDTSLPLDSLKARLASSPADVRIAILDSCRSGALTRTKGARRAPAFAIQADGPTGAKGLVILTSSASDEDSQESDLVGGSYFSHHLASGLLGGADKSGDGRVTLFEAYAYAYDRTVADTAESAAGAQHPTFSYDLAGNGDLVLTDVAARREGIYLPREAPSGVYYLVDREGFVAAEIVKNEGGDRRVALAPGRYRVKRRLADRLRVGELDVSSGQMITLDESHLRDAPFSDDPVKGVYRGDVASRWTIGVGGGFQSVFDAPTRETLFPPTGLVGLELQLRDFFRRDWVWGVDAAGGGATGVVALPSTNAPFHFSELSLATSLVVEWPRPLRSLGLTPFVGGRLALLLMNRRFDDDAFPAQYFSTLSPGVVAGVNWHLSRSWALVARGRVHYLLYNVDENRSLGFWELATAVSYDL